MSTNKIYDFLPGISGYGQIAPKGKTGNKGTSVYYAAYRLTDPDEYTACIEHIKNNLELSNNYKAPINGSYIAGDIIIDNTGMPYFLITNVNNEFELTPDGGSIQYSADAISEVTTVADKAYLSVECVTSNLKSNKEHYSVKNPKYRANNPIISPQYLYYRSYFHNYAGNWIRMRINNYISSNSNLYKFVFVLPNGKTYSEITNNFEHVFFIANTEFYSCIAEDADTEILFNALGQEYSATKEFSKNMCDQIYNIFIKEKCYAYVDIINQSSGNTHRYIFETGQVIESNPESITYEVVDYNTTSIFNSYMIFENGIRNEESITDTAHNFYYVSENSPAKPAKDKVLRLHVKNISVIDLFGRINKYNPEDPTSIFNNLVKTPKCAVYVGYPNTPLTLSEDGVVKILYNNKYTSYVDDDTISSNTPDSNVSFININVGYNYENLDNYFIDIALAIENDNSDADHRKDIGFSFNEDSFDACGQSDFIIYPIKATNTVSNANTKLNIETING